MNGLVVMSCTAVPVTDGMVSSQYDEYISRLYEIYKERLYAYCLKMVGDPHEAQDLTQDIFIKLLSHSEHKIPSGSGDRSVLAWLFTVARNCCLDHLRRKKTFQGKLKTLMSRCKRLVQRDDTSAEVIKRSVGYQILSRLPEKQRSLLLLKSCVGLTYQEIAQIYNTTPNTVAVLLTRARKQALKIAKEEGIDLASR